MPRVSAPHASFIASADLPILPFLAPRVFAESLISRRSQSQHGKSGRAQEEEEKTAAYDKNIIESIPHRFEVRDSRWSYTLNSSLGPQHQGTAAGLPLLGKTRPQCSYGTNGTQSHRVQHIYADISFFARQHLRRFSTAEPSNRQVASGTRSSQRRRRGIRPAHASSVLTQNGPKLAAKRDKALALERQRLFNYVSRLPPGLGVTDLNKKGQYRSLCRRIFNLEYWDATQMDLSGLTGNATKQAGLSRAFALLDRTVYPSLGQHTRKVEIKHDRKCIQLSAKLFPPTKARWTQVRANWLELDVETRKTWFERLLLYLLDCKSGRVLRFIKAITMDPLLRDLRPVAIADALGHLSKIHGRGIYLASQNWGKDAEANKRTFVPAFVHIFQKVLAEQQDVCSQDLLYNIVQLASIQDLKRVFNCLVEARTRLGFDTLLHYANAFGEAGNFHYALRCLDELKARHTAVAWQSVVDRERLRWTCALILRKSMNKSKNYHDTPGIVASFVSLGIKMDTLLYNVVMHNAMEACDYATAFKVYNTLETNGMKPDKHTFSILLHGCSSQSNPAMFQSFAQHCAEVARDIKDPWLASDYLYYLYIRHQNDPDIGHTSALLWKTYLGFFHGTSLEQFLNQRTRDTMNKNGTAQTSGLLEPPPMAMYIILQTEIKLALAVSTQRVLNLYQRFKLLASNPDFKALTRNPTIWNAFLLAFCQKQQFASASQVIKDMTEGSPQPNIYSWNIFMQAFFKTGQVQAADRVFEIMRSRGVDPDQFTYGVLLRGYAKAQLVERIGDTMQHVNTEQEIDPDLLRALAKVVDRRKLMYTLEKSRVHKEIAAQEKANEDAEVERQRWELSQLTPLPPNSSSQATLVSEYVPVEPQKTVSQQFREPPIASQEPSTLHQKPPVLFLAAEESTTQPQISDPYDPELQYRKLEGKLGIVPSQTGFGSPSKAQTPLKTSVNTFGADLGFKSMISDDYEQPEVSKDLPESGVSSKVPANQSQPRISKILPKFSARRIFLRETPDKKEK